MPQQQDYIWEFDYQGYRLKFQGRTKPTDEQIAKAYAEMLAQEETKLPNQRSIEIGGIETTDDRAKRNVDEVGSNEPDKIYQDAKFWDRVGDKFLSGLPHFGFYESKVAPADDSWEYLADAVGGVTGGVAGLGLTSLVTGGVMTPLKAGTSIKKYQQVQTLYKQARKANRAGDAVRAKKLRDQAASIAKSNEKIFRETFTIPAGKGKNWAEFHGYKATGLLGSINAYKKGINALSVNSPRLARAANLFVSNTASFTALGQAQVKPWAKFEERASRMGKDAKTSLVFSVAGLPTPLGLSSKVVQRGVEPALVFGAGFYSDLGETDMSWEERTIHGATFLGFHAFRKGMNRVQVKEQISTALRMADPTLSEAKFRSIKNGKAIERVVEMAEEMVIKEPKYMMWSSRKNPDNQVEFIRLEKPKSKQGKPKIIFRDVNTGEYNSLATSTFYKNFSKNVIHPPAERKVVKDLTKEEVDKLESLENHQKELNEAAVSNRYGEPRKVQHRDVELELKNPFTKKIGLEEVKKWEKRIDDTTKQIDSFRRKNKEALKDPNWKEEYPGLAYQMAQLDRQRYTANLRLNDSYKKVHLSEQETFDPATDKFSVGEFVKIPAVDETTNSLDYTKAGIGKYIGTMKDFAPGSVIAPDWMQREPSRYSNYFKDIPVFEVRTNKGTKKVKVAIGGNLPDDVAGAIGRANLLDKPIMEYARDNPEMQEFRDNPIVQETGGRFKATSWNPDSKIFDELFVPTSKARGNWEKREIVQIDKEAWVDVPDSKIIEVATALGLNNTQDFHRLRRKVRQFEEWWDKKGHPEMMIQSQRAGEYIPVEDRGRRAGIRKSRQAEVKGAWDTERWKEIERDARKSGYTGSNQELLDFFKEFQVEEKGVVSESYVARPEYVLKKIKSSDGTKLFPQGTPSFEGAMRLEVDKISNLNDKLTTQREKIRKNFEKLRGANPAQWPDMNKMEKKLPLEESLYESYPEFNPKYDKPWVADVFWDARTLDKIETKDGTLSQDGEDVRFATEEEAKNYIADHWVNQEAVEKLISNNINHIASIRGDDYKIKKQQQRKLHSVVRKAGWKEKDYRDFLRTFWPESKGSSENMTYEELELATTAFEHPDVNQSYLDLQSSILPPANVLFSTKPKLRKFLLGVQKLTLPTYTVNMMQQSKVAFDWGRRGMAFEIERQNNVGMISQYLHELKKEFGLSDKQFDHITHIVDPKFEDLFDPKTMENLPIEDIQKYYREMQDIILTKFLLENKVEVRDNSTSNLAYKDFFSVYTKAGEKIELANQWDAVRVSKGVEFVDSNLNFNKPVLEKYAGRIVEFEPIRKKRYSQEYLQSLRSIDPRTGKEDNGWFIEGNKRYVPVWEGDKVVNLKEYKRNEVENSKGEKVKIHDKDGNSGKYDSHIVDFYLTRIVHQKFHDEFVKPDFGRELVEYWANMNPEIANMAISMSKKRQLAELMKHRLSSFISNSGGVYGTIHTRIANLPPLFLFDKNNKLILTDKLIDVEGNPAKKGSQIIDKDGEKRTVSRILPVYETSFSKIMAADANRVGHQAASYKYFGRNGANNERFLGESATASDAIKDGVGEIAMLAKETSTDYAIWAHKSMQLQINSLEPATTLDKIASRITSWTAQTILSTPKAGIKNAILGNAANANVFGFRQLFNSWSRVLRDPKSMSSEARKRGALQAGVHEIVAGKGYSKYNPGGMYISEMTNRTLSVSIAEPALRDAINNLNGIKTPTNVGTSRKSSLRLLNDTFKFRDEAVKDMMELGADRLHERPEYIDQASTMAHAITQGAPTLPFIPQWMGKRWSKPVTLFHRIAYRMEEIIGNSVIKPLAVNGNPFPFVRWLAVAAPSGAMIVAMHYLLLDKDVRNKFKDGAGQFMDYLSRAEWLGVISNAFDGHGDVVDSYSPATWKVLTAIWNNINFLISGQKYPFQAFDDALRQVLLAYDDIRTIYENSAKPNVKKYTDSKRRQRQFQDVYFKDKGFKADEADLLTENTPEYRIVKSVFWSDESEEEKAKAYWTSIKAVMTHDLNDDPSVEKLKHKVRGRAEKIISGIISKQRPIPTSWRQLGTGTKTRKDLYYSLLSPEDKAKEDEIESIYQEKKVEWNNLIENMDYIKKYAIGVFGD